MFGQHLLFGPILVFSSNEITNSSKHPMAGKGWNLLSNSLSVAIVMFALLKGQKPAQTFLPQLALFTHKTTSCIGSLESLENSSHFPDKFYWNRYWTFCLTLYILDSLFN